MKAALKNFFLVPFLGIFLLGMNAWGQESHSETASRQPQKVYVSPDQVEVTDNGILFYSEFWEDPILGKSLSYDEHGLYIELKQAYCPIITHGPKCNKCGGCHMTSCPCCCICGDKYPW